MKGRGVRQTHEGPYRRGRVRVPLAFLAAALSLSGCFADLLVQGPMTTRNFACFVLDPEGPPLEIVVQAESESAYDPVVPATALEQELVRVSGREPGSIGRSFLHGPAAPEGGWTQESLDAWAATQVVEEADLRLHVLWAQEADLLAPSGARLAPGVVVVVHEEVVLGAERLERPVDEVAAWVLMHQVGHALGQVNDGVPVQDPDLAKRENPPKHDPSPGSVMHTGWHAAATMPRNVTEPMYPEAALEDWDAARAPGGVCGR